MAIHPPCSWVSQCTSLFLTLLHITGSLPTVDAQEGLYLDSLGVQGKLRPLLLGGKEPPVPWEPEFGRKRERRLLVTVGPLSRKCRVISWGHLQTNSVCFITGIVSSIRAILLPNHAFTLPTFCIVSSSLSLAMEFVLPIFQSLPVLLTLMWISVIYSCIHARRWLRVLLLCHLPSLYLLCFCLFAWNA